MDTQHGSKSTGKARVKCGRLEQKFISSFHEYEVHFLDESHKMALSIVLWTLLEVVE